MRRARQASSMPAVAFLAAVLAAAAPAWGQDLNIDSITDTMALQDAPVRTDTNYQVVALQVTVTGEPIITAATITEMGTVAASAYLSARAYISRDLSYDSGDIQLGSGGSSFNGTTGVATARGVYKCRPGSSFYILWLINVANNTAVQNTTTYFRIGQDINNNPIAAVTLESGSVTSSVAFPWDGGTRTIPKLYQIPSQYATLTLAETAAQADTGMPRVIQVDDGGSYPGVDVAGGTYTSANYLIIRAKRGNAPVVDPANNDDGFNVAVPYVTIAGFRITGVTQSGPPASWAPIWITATGDFTTVKNCVMYGNDGVNVLDIFVADGAGGVSVINNTAYRTGGDKVSLQLDANATDTVTLRNNIFVDTRTGDGMWYVAAAADMGYTDYNCWYAPNSASPFNIAGTAKNYATWKSDLAGISADVNSISDTTTDPLFVDVATSNFYLKSTCGVPTTWARTGTATTDHSPCIDAGRPAAGANDPYLYEPFDNGGRIDQGSYGNTQWASKSASSLPNNYWTGAGGTSEWNTDANWSAGIPLGGTSVNGVANSHSVIIQDAANQPILSTANAVAYGLTIQGVNTPARTVWDPFADGDYANNPAWTVGSGDWGVSAGLLINNPGQTDTSEDLIYTAGEQAYGFWQFTFRLDGISPNAGAYPYIAFFAISSSSTFSTTDGYYLFIEGDRNTGSDTDYFILRKRAAGVDSVVVNGRWTSDSSTHTATITRSPTGSFAVYLDGTLVVVAGGTNPATNNDYTTSAYLGVAARNVYSVDQEEIDNVQAGHVTLSLFETASDYALDVGGGGVTIQTGAISMVGTDGNADTVPEMITVAGNWSQTGGIFRPTGGRVRFDGAGLTQTVALTSGNFFREFEVNGSSNTVQLASTVRVDGGWLMTAGTLDINGQTLDVNAAATLAGGTLTMDAAADAITISADWTESGTFAFAGTNGTVTFDPTPGGATTYTITPLSTNNFYHLSFAGNSNALFETPTAVANRLTVNGNLSLSGGTLNHSNGAPAGDKTHTVAGNLSQTGGTLQVDNANERWDVNGNFSSSAGTLQLSSSAKLFVAGNVSITGTATFTAATATTSWFYLDGAGSESTPQTVVVTPATSDTIGTLAVRHAANSNVSKASGTVNVRRLFIDQGIFDPNGQTVNVLESNPLYGLVVGNSPGSVSEGSFTQGQLRVGSSGGTVDVENSVFLRNTGALSMSGGRLRVGRSFVDDRPSGSFALTGGTVEFDRATTTEDTGIPRRYKLRSGDAFYNVEMTGAGTVEPYDDAAQTLVINGNFTQFAGTWYMRETVAPTPTNVAMDLGGNFAMTGGTFDAGSATHTVAGNWDDSGGTFRPTAGTVKFDGTAAGLTIKTSGANAAIDNDVSGNHFFNLEIAAGASSVVEFQDTAATTHSALEVNGLLTVTSGTLKLQKTAAGAEVADIDGTITVNGGRLDVWSLSDLWVAGDVTLNGGTLYLRSVGSQAPALRLGGGAGGLVVNSGATFQTIGSTSVPRLTWDGATRFEFTANSGSTVNVEGLDFSGCNGNGLHVSAGATIVDLDEAAFTNGAGNGASSNRFLWLEPASGSWNFSGCSFDASTDYNVVRAAGSTATFEFSITSGAQAGETYEWDKETAPDGTSGTQTPGQIRWRPTRDWTGDALNGDWSDSGNWAGGAVPAVDGSEDVRIPGGLLTPYPSINETATLGSAGAAAAYNLFLENGTPAGNINMVDTVGTAKLYVTGDLRMRTGTSLTSNNNTDIRIRGDWRSDGLFTIGTSGGWVTFEGTNFQSIVITDTFPNLRVSNTGSARVIVTANITTADAVQVDDDGGLDISGITFNVGGNFTTNGTVELIVAGSTVRFRRDTVGTQTIGGTASPAFNHVEVGGGIAPNTVDTARNVDVNGNLTIQSNGTFDLSGERLNLAGTLTIAGGGTFNTTGSTSEVVYDGTSAQSVAAAPYDHLTISNSGATATAAAGLGVGGNFTVSSGGSFNVNGNPMTVRGDFTVASGGSWTAGGAITLDGTAAQNLTNAAAGGVRFSSLTIGSAGTVWMGGDFDVDGALTVANGASNPDLNLGGGTIKIGGGFTRTGQVAPGTSTVVFDTASQTIPAGAYYHLTVSGTTGNLGGAIDVDGDLSIVSGTLDVVANNNINLGGNWTNTGGTFVSGYGSDEVLLDGTGTQTVGTETFYNLRVSKSAGTAQLTGTITVEGTLEMGSGTLSIVGAQTIKIGVAILISGGTFQVSGSTPTITTWDTVTPTYYAVQIPGGTVAISRANISYVNGFGVTIENTATLQTFDNVTFSNHENTGGVDYFLRVARSGANSSKTLTGVTFGSHVSGSDKDVLLTDTDADGDPNDHVLVFSQWNSSYSVEANRETESSARIDWYNAVNWVGQWRYRLEIGSELTTSETSGETICVQFDTKTTPTAATVLASTTNADDLRVLYYDASAGSYTEMARQLVGDHTTFTSSIMLQIYFQMPVDFAAGDKVWLYYGNSSPVAAPSATLRTSSFSDDFEANNLALWTYGANSATSSTANWQRTYGVRPDGTNAAFGYVYEDASFPAQGTAEAWVRTPTASSTAYTGLVLNSTTSIIAGMECGVVFESGTIKYLSGAGTWTNFASPISYTTNTWYHFRIDYNNTLYTYDVYVDGNLKVSGISYNGTDAAVILIGLLDYGSNSTSGFDSDNAYLYGGTFAATLNSFGAPATDITLAGFDRWTEPFNWSPPGIPSATTDCIVNSGYTYAPIVTAAGNAATLAMGSSGGGTPALTLNALLNVSGAVRLGASAASSITLEDVNLERWTINGELTIDSAGATINGGASLPWIGVNGNVTGIGSLTTSNVIYRFATSTSDQYVYGPVNLAHVTIDKTSGVVYAQGTVTFGQDLTLTQGTLRVSSGSTLQSTGASSSHSVAAGATFELRAAASNATLNLANGSTLTVRGALRLVRDSGSGSAVIDATGGGANSYGLDIGDTGGSAGTLEASDFILRRTGANGLRVNSGGTITRLRDGTFEENNGVYLNLAAVTGGAARAIPYTLPNLTFNGSSGYNVRAGWNMPKVFVSGGSGTRWGESYDDDAWDNVDGEGRVAWSSATSLPLVRRVSDSATFAGLASAVADGGTINGTRLVPVRAWPLSESVSTTKGVILERLILAPHDGATALTDTDGATGGQATLRNCLVLRGGLNTVVAQNCTLLDSSGALSFTSCTFTNCLIESDAAGSGNTATTTLGPASCGADNFPAVGPTWFVSPANLDFHLKAPVGVFDESPAWEAAVDTGTDLSASWPDDVDFDGNARPVNGDGLGIAEWDIGADEYNPVAAGSFSSIPASVNATNLGSISSMAAVSKRKTRSNVAYVVGGGGSGAGSRNTHLVVMDMADEDSDGDLEEWAVFDANYPILGVRAFAVSLADATYEVRLYLMLDTNGDGFADGILAVIDTGGEGTGFAWNVDNLAAGYSTPQTDANRTSWYRGPGGIPASSPSLYADYSFDQDGTADGVNHLPAGAQFVMPSLNWGESGDDPGGMTSRDNRVYRLRLAGASRTDAGTYNELNSILSADPGFPDLTVGSQRGVLYKLNVDPLDYTDNANGARYGRVVWHNASYNWDWQGSSIVIIGTGYAYYPISNDTPNTPNEKILARVNWRQSASVRVLNIWDASGAPEAQANSFGPVTTLYTLQGKIVMGFTDQPRLVALTPGTGFTVTTASVAGGATTVPVQDTSLFSSAPGGPYTAYIEGDTFTYEDRSTASGPGSLTGVLGVDSAHSSGVTVSNSAPPVGSNWDWTSADLPDGYGNANTARPALRLGGSFAVAATGRNLRKVRMSTGASVGASDPFTKTYDGAIRSLWTRDQWIAYGTDAGEIVIAQYDWNETSITEKILDGFPYRVPGHRIVGAVGYTLPSGQWAFLFRTDGGLVLRFDRQPP